MTYDDGLLTGMVSASGTYDRIEVLSGSQMVATSSVLPLTVDFGTCQAGGALGIVGNLATGALQLLLGASTTNETYANLNLVAIPNLPDLAFADGVNATGGSGIDILRGADAMDTLSGGAGNDLLIGGAGAHVLDGGAGYDQVLYATSTQGLIADLSAPATANTGDAAGDSFDVARYDNAGCGVTAVLINAGLNTGDAAGDVYLGIEAVVGSAFSDVLIGDTGSNLIAGQDGNDFLDGYAGNDLLYGGAGADIFSFKAGSGQDVVGDFTPGRGRCMTRS